MSYEIKVGQEAFEAATAEKKDYSKVLAKFKDGSVYKVRIPNAQTFCQYFAHGVFGSFYTTVHTPDDLYCQASSYYYNEAKKAEEAGDEKGAEALKQKGYELKKKERYLFGFFDLSASGNEILIDVTKKQAVGLMKTIKKYEGKYDKFAFELSKSGSGQATMVSIDPVIDIEDLKSAEQDAFTKTQGKAFDNDVFGKVFVARSVDEQREDLTKYGMDVSVLGGATEGKQEEQQQEGTEQKYNF